MNRANEQRNNYKKIALKAAKELMYSQAVIDKIKATKDENQISQIMRSARANGGKLSEET